MLIDKQLLDLLTQQAQTSPRLRMHYDLRESIDEESQRMLNAIEPGSEIPVHRHNDTSEIVVIIRGKVEEVFYDNNGTETDRFLLEPYSPIASTNSNPAVIIPKCQYHTCQSLESGSVIIEFKNGRYDPVDTEDYL